MVLGEDQLLLGLLLPQQPLHSRQEDGLLGLQELQHGTSYQFEGFRSTTSLQLNKGSFLFVRLFVGSVHWQNQRPLQFFAGDIAG